MAADKDIVIAALGQPFQLGTLYDQTRDQMIAGVTLWDPDELKKNIKSQPKPYSDYELVTEDTLNTKAHVLGIEAELKLGVLCGLVSVSGAAKYVDDKKTSNSHARITGKYSMTTQYDELTMHHLAEQNIKYRDVLNHPKINATHVVVGILYGADGYFVFDRTISNDENHQDVHGHLKISVKKIPKLTVGAGGQVDFNDHNTETTDKLSCKFYGDFEIDTIPTTFKDAVKLYCELPTRIKETDGIRGVPKKVWLHPLSAFTQYKTANIVRNISAGLIDLSVNRIQKLQELEVEANDLINQHSILLNDFSYIKKQLGDFIARLSEFDRQLKEDIRILLPKIRGGDKEALDLDKLSQKIDSSPFNTRKLESWLESKEKELALLATFVSNLKQESVSLLSAPLEGTISNTQCAFICHLCLHFTESNEPQISQMHAYLVSQFETNTSATTDVAIASAWYKTPDIINKIQIELCQFIGFAQVNRKQPNIKCIVTEDYADNYNNVKGASVMLYRRGKLETSFQIPSQPGVPHPTQITSNSITLEWTKPERSSDCVIKYKILYRIHRNDEDNVWNESMTDTAIELITISNLVEKTVYVFKVQPVTIAGECMASDISCLIETPRVKIAGGLTHNLQTRRKPGINGYPDIHEIEYHEKIINPDFRLRKCFIGQPTSSSGWHASEKIIMMVGATGAGKSTMINAFVNYYYGIRWKDNFRLRLITEEDEGINGVAQSQTRSQTKFITAYTLYRQSDCAVPYTLTIIDTPGFGDVEGIKRDDEIRNQIREFFMITGTNGIDHLDAIGFVIQNSVNRLTPTQTYIFDSILGIFGKDISSNMFSLITFADGLLPPVLKAIDEANIPSKAYFKFNNSALFAANQSNDEDETNIDDFFWKIGIVNLKNFFIEFQKVESVSLTLTKEVLNERQHLEAFVQGIQQQIKIELGKLEELKQEIQVLKEHNNDILKNKSFTYKILVTKQCQISLPKGTYVTNCLQCNRTCHYPCQIDTNEKKYRCNAMTPKNQNAQCSVCPDKCSWTLHANNCYRYELYEENEMRTIEDMKERYQKAKLDGEAAQDLYESLKNDLKKTRMKVYGMIHGAQQAIERLDQIALKPNPLTSVDYIELMIQSEEQETKPGWKQRIDHLHEAKTIAETIQHVKNETYDDLLVQSSDLERLDSEYKNYIDEMKEHDTKPN